MTPHQRKEIRRFKPSVLAAAIAFPMIPVVPVMAQQTGDQSNDATQAEQAYSFDISAKPLPQAITDFSAVTGVQVLYTGEDAFDFTASALQGSYTATQALDRLLLGSGLGYRFTSEDSVTLEGDSSGSGTSFLAPVTVTASRMERSVSTIPGSVSVIESEELDQQRQVTRDIQRILQQSVPGFRGATGNRSEGSNALRGRTALILQNGVPQTVQIRTSGTGINNIDPRSVERIEVARTANATLGFGGAGGTINLITKRPESPVPLTTLEVGTSFQPLAFRTEGLTKEAFASVEGREDQFDYLFSLSARDIGEFYDAEGDRIPDGSTEANSEEYGLASSLGWELDAERSLRLDLSYRRVQEDDNRTEAANAVVGEKKAEAVPNTLDTFNPFYDPLQAWNASLTFDDDDVLGSALNAQTFYQRQELNVFGSCGVCVPSVAEQTRVDQRIGGRLNIDTPLPNGASLVWGGDIVRNDNSELRDSGSANLGDVGNRPDITQDNYAAFAQVDVPLGDFLITGGVRHDIFDVDLGDVTKPDGSSFVGGKLDVDETLFNVGLVYYLTNDVELFTGFSQALDITQPGRAAATVDRANQIRLEPAVTDSYEIGTRYFGDRWDGSLTAFYTDSELSSRTTNPGGALRLAIPLRQPERIWGVESTLNVRLDDQWKVGGTASYQEGEREVDGEWQDLQGTFIQPFRLTGYGEYDPLAWLSTRLQFEYSPDSDRFPGSTTFGEGEVSELFLMDFIASAQTRHGEFRLGLENLLNKQYVSQYGEATNVAPNYYAQPGLTARLSYRVQF